MNHPKDVGDRTTLAVMLALSELGYEISVPFGENTRYDLVIDDGVRLSRVQCKSGRLRGGAVRWAACSSYAHHGNPREPRRDYLGQVDFFGIYCPGTESVYLVPIEDAQVRREGALRVNPPKNGQRRFIREAQQYEIGRLATRTTGEPDATSGA
jgi:hypothetical protein